MQHVEIVEEKIDLLPVDHTEKLLQVFLSVSVSEVVSRPPVQPEVPDTAVHRPRLEGIDAMNQAKIFAATLNVLVLPVSTRLPAELVTPPVDLLKE